jgi:hypothetical protein
MFEEDIKIVRGKRNVAVYHGGRLINQGVRPQDEVFADNVQMYVEARAGLTAHKEGNTTRFSQI